MSEKIKLIFTLRNIPEKLVDDSLFYLLILKDYALYTFPTLILKLHVQNVYVAISELSTCYKIILKVQISINYEKNNTRIHCPFHCSC